ncbi:NucA/NucB deoxyribonuclease domain-containing protein [Streptomyces sp. NPDC000987]|uniref:NucA/NucB deoxyribonuclease domain-containing protein n=1 Tax=Streptomyces sp. NPDC000987 TaxID=3154374 RepID=UPI00332E1C00
MRKLLAAGVVSLGLLGSCLSAAQEASADDSGSGAATVQSAEGAVSAAEVSVPLPEDLDESSQELDEAISLPAPAALEEQEPAAAADAPQDESGVAEGIVAPDPVASAPDDEADCRARVAAAIAHGSESPVPCVTWGASATTAELRAAADAWPTPKWCGEHGANGKWYVTRFKACGVFPSDLTVTDVRTGQVTGRMHYLAVAYAYSKRDIKTWAYQVELLEVTSSGSAKGSSASGKATCAGKCKVAESKFPSQLMGASKDPVGQFFLDTTIQTSPKGQQGEGQASAAWRFTNPEWAAPSNDVVLPTPPVRCDNALPATSKAGCVMPYIAEMVYAKNGEFPELAQHIEYAQNTENLPGKHGTTRYLTRLTDRVKIRGNRTTACPSSIVRPPNKSCDEYPFASTWQGASTGGGNFSRRMINATQNEDGGRALSRFYLYNRIIEKDKFLVWIK